MSDRNTHKRTSGSMTVVAEEHEDGTFEIHTESVEPASAGDEQTTDPAGARSAEGGSAGGWIGLAVVLALLGAGVYLVFVAPRAPKHDPARVAAELNALEGQPSAPGVGADLTNRVREGGPVRVDNDPESPALHRSLLRRSRPARIGEENPAHIRNPAARQGGQGRPTSFQGPRGGVRGRSPRPHVADPAAAQGRAGRRDSTLIRRRPAPVGDDSTETRVLGPPYPVENSPLEADDSDWNESFPLRDRAVVAPDDDRLLEDLEDHQVFEGHDGDDYARAEGYQDDDDFDDGQLEDDRAIEDDDDDDYARAEGFEDDDDFDDGQFEDNRAIEDDEDDDDFDDGRFEDDEYVDERDDDDLRRRREADPLDDHRYDDDIYVRDEYNDDDYVGDEYDEDEYDEDEYDEDEYHGDEYNRDEYHRDEYHGDEYNRDEYHGDEYHGDEYR